MDTIVVEGMVLSSMPIGEYDRRLLILTSTHGKISAFARGSRRQGSTLQAASRIFTTGEFTLHEGRDSSSVLQVVIREPFEELARDPLLTAYGCYFLEAAGYFSRENVPAKGILNLLFLALKALSGGSMKPEQVRRFFELRLFGEEGTYPEVFTCHRCGKPFSSGRLLISRGYSICADCLKETGEEAGELLDEASVRLLQYILTVPLARLFKGEINDEGMQVLSRVTDRWKNAWLGHDFNSYRVLKEMLDLIP